MKKVWILGIASLSLLAACNEQDEEIDLDEVEDDEVEEAEENGHSYVVSEAETFIEHMTNQEFEVATEQFDEEMIELLPPDELEEVWITVTDLYGNYESHTLHDVREPEEGYETVVLFATFENGDVYFVITYNEDGEIAGFYVEDTTV